MINFQAGLKITFGSFDVIAMFIKNPLMTIALFAVNFFIVRTAVKDSDIASNLAVGEILFPQIYYPIWL